MEEFIAQLCRDKKLQARFVADPAKAIARFALSPSERAAILRSSTLLIAAFTPTIVASLPFGEPLYWQ